MLKIFIPIFFIGSLGLSSCYYDKAELLYPNSFTCDTAAAKFSVVKPIILAKCATSGCHDAASQAAGYDFSTYSLISSQKTAIYNASILSTRMPRGTSYSTAERANIKCWIDAGGLNN